MLAATMLAAHPGPPSRGGKGCGLPRRVTPWWESLLL